MNNSVVDDLCEFERDLEASACGYPGAPDDLVTYIRAVIRAEMYLERLERRDRSEDTDIWTGEYLG